MDIDREVNLAGLGLDRGGHLLVERVLDAMAPGERLRGRETNSFY